MTLSVRGAHSFFGRYPFFPLLRYVLLCLNSVCCMALFDCPICNARSEIGRARSRLL